MPEKSPETYSLITYLWVTILALWGGLVSYRRRVARGEIEKFSLMELIGELSTSAFAGVITFYICEASGFPQVGTAAIVGIAGHMGGRAIVQFENWIKHKVK